MVLILDGLTPFGVSVCFSLWASSVLFRLVPGHLVLLGWVRPSSVLTVNNKICDIRSSGCFIGVTSTSPSARNKTNPLYEAIHYANGEVDLDLSSRG